MPIDLSEVWTLEARKHSISLETVPLMLGTCSMCNKHFLKCFYLVCCCFYITRVIGFNQVKNASFTFIHFSDVFIQTDLQSIQGIQYHYVFSGNLTQNFCAANTMLLCYKL